MRKIAYLFVLSVLVPSFLLAALAFRSLRDQELVLERQRQLMYEAAAQNVAKDINEFFAREQLAFGQAIERALGKGNPARFAESFDSLIVELYSLGDVGFAVSLEKGMLSPSLLGRPEARRFRLENEMFLTSKETAQVYWNGPKGPVNLSELDDVSDSVELGAYDGTGPSSATTEFRDLIADEHQGIVARYLQDNLTLMIWYRSPLDEGIVFGARLNLARVTEEAGKLLHVDASLKDQILLVLFNEDDQPAAYAEAVAGVQLKEARPFASVEIGDYLPHWKIGVLLRDPSDFRQSASSLRVLFGLLISVLVIAIVVGGWLIVSDMNRELKLAKQRRDFVSNVSHELKTPLTSIRMFSEMLAEGRVSDPTKQRQFSSIIATETARLTRLINNVLDFSRMERGEKRYHLEHVSLVELVRRTVEQYRPQLESSGFSVTVSAQKDPLYIRADPDALTQILLNLLSNAEKYSESNKAISVRITSPTDGWAEVRVLDRGRGVPRGIEEKIFEQFFRGHDSLAEGIQGAGLGLSLARQIARGHGGDVLYEPREGGGSCFILKLPASTGVLGSAMEGAGERSV